MKKEIEKEIREIANYCLNCKIKPCSTKGCPLQNDIPSFIGAVKEDDYKKAYEILSNTTVLPGVCGIICPHTKQCQGSCIRGIKGKAVDIGKIENFIFEKAVENKYELKSILKEEANSILTDKKIAIVGGGPAGLTCAAFLAKDGINVTIFEKHNQLGGLLVHGIPEFRLDRNTIKNTIEKIIDLGIDIQYNKELGKNLDIQELEKEYDAIFLAIGANKSLHLNVKGEELKGVFGGNELLEYNKHPNYTGKTAAVIGGGNVAMDCARTINRLGAQKVFVIYRRSEEQMPAEKQEIEAAKKEGIEFLFQNNIVKILGDNKVEKIELIKTKLIKKEGEKRLIPINIENSNYEIKTDFVIRAIGSQPSEEVSSLDLEKDSRGKVLVNKKFQTSNEIIFAGGDLAGCNNTVAWAAQSGREAAKSIKEFLLKL